MSDLGVYIQTSAVLVKSISIVHHGYAVSARVTQSQRAFCSLYTLGHRTTWALLPWSVAFLSWLSPAHRIKHIKVGTVRTRWDKAEISRTKLDIVSISRTRRDKVDRGWTR